MSKDRNPFKYDFIKAYRDHEEKLRFQMEMLTQQELTEKSLESMMMGERE